MIIDMNAWHFLGLVISLVLVGIVPTLLLVGALWAYFQREKTRPIT